MPMHTSIEIRSMLDSHRTKLEDLRDDHRKVQRQLGEAVMDGSRDQGSVDRWRQAVQREEDIIDALSMLAAEAELAELQKRSEELGQRLDDVKQRARGIDDEIAEKSKYGGLIGDEILRPLRETYHAARSEQTNIEQEVLAISQRLLQIEREYPHVPASAWARTPAALVAS